ncbi:50S ribosomal protein L17 [Amnibacterium sp.]|uniref:50S ribosomal protein L17 n=1 Tax=Amnibacterium sp. TaxID=1872496 RepID=UPI003F7BCDB6
MPRPTKGPRLGGGPAHERMLLGQLASQLFEHRSIQTTEAKAKRLRPVAERLVTFAKRGDLHARRRVMRTINDKTVVHELFTEIAPLVAERQGGYTRITKTGFRKGDNAPMAVIELVLEPVAPKRSSRTRPSSSVSPAVPVEETETVEESAPVEPEAATPEAAEVEESAAQTAEDAPEAEAPAADEPTTPDEKPATPAS